ncbi:hypothetical protein TNCV_1546321 [Trichonephila clavipes]|nr:hypothetical protein TNCV_1546321 [Trichonephila clavipes]
MAFLGKAKKQDLVLLAEELGQKVSDKMTNIELRNIIIGSKDYEEEFVRDQLSVILEERFEREKLNELRLEIESIRSNVKRTSCAEDRKKTSSNYRISIGRAEEHVRETSPAVLMAEATIPVNTPIKEEKGMDDLRVVYVKVKGEQEMVNAVIDTGAQMPVVRLDVVEGQSIDNRGSIQITSAFGEHEMGEVKDSNMELNDFRHGVVPVSKNLVNDILICCSDFEGLIENWQMVRNPAILREPSGEEGIINSINSKSVCSQEVVTDLLPETQSLLNVPNGDLVAVKINASNVQTNGQGIKESKREVAFTCVFKNRILYSNRRGQPLKILCVCVCLKETHFNRSRRGSDKNGKSPEWPFKNLAPELLPAMAAPIAEIVRVQYFVRGGFVGHRSPASSKHLSLIFRSTGLDSSGVKKGLRCSCKMHVWVSGPTKMPTDVDVRRSDVTALALSYRTFPLRKV